jgi:hypothetical protein
VLESILNLFFILKIPDPRGPPFGLLLPTPGPTCQNLISTWRPGHASSSMCLLSPVARAGIQLGPIALVRRTPLEVLSEILHRHHLARAVGECVRPLSSSTAKPTLSSPSAVSRRPCSACSGCRSPHPHPFRVHDCRALVREELAPRASQSRPHRRSLRSRAPPRGPPPSVTFRSRLRIHELL